MQIYIKFGKLSTAKINILHLLQSLLLIISNMQSDRSYIQKMS